VAVSNVISNFNRGNYYLIIKLKYFYRRSRRHINAYKIKMDFIKNNTEEFQVKLIELNEFYKLFASFSQAEIPEERREIILDNLIFQILNAEKEYTQKCIRT